MAFWRTFQVAYATPSPPPARRPLASAPRRHFSRLPPASASSLNEERESSSRYGAAMTLPFSRMSDNLSYGVSRNRQANI